MALVSLGSSGSVRVVVFDSRIQAMNAPGGSVNTYVRTKTQTAATVSKAVAPKRTGWLAANIRTDVREVRNGSVGRVRSNARYSAWVHEGTGPVIYPHGEFLWVPVSRHSLKRKERPFVAGQKANPFLVRGLEAAMAQPYFSRRLLGDVNPFG